MPTGFDEEAADALLKWHRVMLTSRGLPEMNCPLVNAPEMNAPSPLPTARLPRSEMSVMRGFPRPPWVSAERDTKLASEF
jgi:hypothetical protein